MTIQEQVEQYSEHLGDLDYIDMLLASIDLDTLFEIITRMLQSGNQAQILNVNLFIRDIINFGIRAQTRSFHERFYTSIVIDALHKNVFSPFHFVRESTIYTIGKVGLTTSIGLLSEAFNYFLDRDPLLLSGLLSELRWLGDSQIWDRIDQMAQSAFSLTRWAIFSTSFFQHFDIVRDGQESAFIQKQAHFLNLLKTDSYLLLRQEAEYKSREFDFAQISRDLKKPERKKARKELEMDKPINTFFVVNLRFLNFMVKTNKADYSLAEIEDFIRQLELGNVDVV